MRSLTQQEWMDRRLSQGTNVIVLRDSDGVRLFQTFSYYQCKGILYSRPPLYHIWNADKRVLSTPDYNTANQKYQKIILENS